MFLSKGVVMGQRQKHEVRLTEEERAFLIKNTHHGEWTAREVKRAQVFLKADKNGAEAKEDWEIAEELGLSREAITALRKRFVEKRVKAIQDKERSGRPKIVDGDVEAHIVAIACSEPPEGRQRWTLRLIAGRVVQLADVESCSYVTVGSVLKKTSLSHGKRKNGKFRPNKMKNLSGEWKKS